MRAFSAFPFLARGLKLFLERPRLRLWVLIPVLVGLVALVPWCWFAPDLLRALRGALPDFLAPETSFAAEPGAWNAFVAALQGAGYAVLRWGAHLLALLLVLLSGLLLLLFAVKVVGAAANDRLLSATSSRRRTGSRPVPRSSRARSTRFASRWSNSPSSSRSSSRSSCSRTSCPASGRWSSRRCSSSSARFRSATTR